MKSDYFDTAALKQLRLSRGLSQKALSLEAGLGARFVEYLENGKKDPDAIAFSAASRLAQALGVQTDVFSKQERLGWERAVWSRLDLIGLLQEEFSRSNEVISISQGIDGYLLPDEWIIWHEAERLAQTGLKGKEAATRSSYFVQWAEGMRRIREAKSFRHRIIGREEVLIDVGRKRPSLVKAASQSITKFAADKTIVNLADAYLWDIVDSKIKQALMTERWHKLLILDERIVFFWESQDVFRYTRHKATVEKLARLARSLEGALPTSMSAIQGQMTKIVSRSSTPPILSDRGVIFHL